MSGSKTNSRALKFYSDVLGLEHLHYGIWDADEELTLANLKIAQERYQQAIIDLLPPTSVAQPVRVLDVGCGTGELSMRLKAKGYEVEGLSPDVNHIDSYAEKTGQPFHHCVFEEFKPTKTYDVVIMSESCQYIALDALFPVLDQCLTEDGQWVVVDYFVLDGVSGTMAKSGHTYTRFQRAVSFSKLTMDYDRDITEATLKTLDFAASLVNRGQTALGLLKQRIDQRSFVLSKLVGLILWLARKEIAKLEENRVLIDSDQFRAAKTYRLMRFKRA